MRFLKASALISSGGWRPFLLYHVVRGNAPWPSTPSNSW